MYGSASATGLTELASLAVTLIEPTLQWMVPVSCDTPRRAFTAHAFCAKDKVSVVVRDVRFGDVVRFSLASSVLGDMLETTTKEESALQVHGDDWSGGLRAEGVVCLRQSATKSRSATQLLLPLLTGIVVHAAKK